MGGASAIVPVFIGELAPTDRRGTLVARNELLIVTGQLLAYTTNAIIATYFPDDHHTWRYMLLLCTIPAVGLFIGSFFLTESPRWLIDQNREGEAKTVLWQLRSTENDAEIEAELQGIKDHSEKMRQATSGSFSDYMRVPWVRKIALIGIALAFLSQMTGVNSVMYYAPSILIDTGLGTNAAIVATIGNGVVSVLAVAIGSLVLLPKMKRRRMLLTGQIGVTISLFLMGASFTFLPESTTRSYLVLVFMMSFLFFMQCFVAVIFWLMLAEIFPLRVRGKVMGMAVFANWFANFLVALVFPPLQEALHGKTFFIFAFINFLTIFFYWKFIPETKGKSLEELEEHFQKTLPSSPLGQEPWWRSTTCCATTFLVPSHRCLASPPGKILVRNQGKLNILVSAVFPCDGDPLGKGNGNGVGGWTIVDDQGLAPIECLGPRCCG